MLELSNINDDIIKYVVWAAVIMLFFALGKLRTVAIARCNKRIAADTSKRKNVYKFERESDSRQALNSTEPDGFGTLKSRRDFRTAIARSMKSGALGKLIKLYHSGKKPNTHFIKIPICDDVRTAAIRCDIECVSSNKSQKKRKNVRKNSAQRRKRKLTLFINLIGFPDNVNRGTTVVEVFEHYKDIDQEKIALILLDAYDKVVKNYNLQLDD